MLQYKQREWEALAKIKEGDLDGARSIAEELGEDGIWLKEVIEKNSVDKYTKEGLAKLKEYLEYRQSAEAKLQKTIDANRERFRTIESLKKDAGVLHFEHSKVEDDEDIDEIIFNVYTKLDEDRIRLLHDYLKEQINESHADDKTYVGSRLWHFQANQKGLLDFATEFGKVYGKRKLNRAVQLIDQLLEQENERLILLGRKKRT